jgi:ketosteroid isomerase-like protein
MTLRHQRDPVADTSPRQTRAVQIDRPDVIAEVRAAFERYEAALLANDLATLDEMFWPDARVVRFGFEDAQYGAESVSAFRASIPRQSPPRRLTHVTVTTFGSDVAVVAAEFVPDESKSSGRQSQVWAKFEGQWKVAHGHVSWRGSAPNSE